MFPKSERIDSYCEKYVSSKVYDLVLLGGWNSLGTLRAIVEELCEKSLNSTFFENKHSFKQIHS